MRFLFLIHGDREAEAALTPDERRAIVAEHMAYASMLRERGAYVLARALDDPATRRSCDPARSPSSPTAPSPRRRRPSAASTSSSAQAARRRSNSPATFRRARGSQEVLAIAET